MQQLALISHSVCACVRACSHLLGVDACVMMCAKAGTNFKALQGEERSSVSYIASAHGIIACKTDWNGA